MHEVVVRNSSRHESVNISSTNFQVFTGIGHRPKITLSAAHRLHRTVPKEEAAAVLVDGWVTPQSSLRRCPALSSGKLVGSMHWDFVLSVFERVGSRREVRTTSLKMNSGQRAKPASVHVPRFTRNSAAVDGLVFSCMCLSGCLDCQNLVAG